MIPFGIEHAAEELERRKQAWMKQPDRQMDHPEALKVALDVIHELLDSGEMSEEESVFELVETLQQLVYGAEEVEPDLSGNWMEQVLDGEAE